MEDKGIMPSEERQSQKKEESREERLEKIRRLIAAHGQEAASLLRKWLQESRERNEGRRR